jgi:hypothetical protein
MLWIHKALAKTTDCYRFWNDRILEESFKINRGYLTILGLYVPEERRNEEAEKCYQQLQEITDKINKNCYSLLMGDLNARTGNRRPGKVIGKNGESTTISTGKRLTGFWSSK